MANDATWEAFLPGRVAALERDHRGYPIPYIVMRDASGNPTFAVNDVLRVQHCIREKRCHICGQHLDPFPWFVGGPGSALLNGDRAVYGNGPMHRDCMHFALQVCPHLLQRMNKAVGPIQRAHLQREGVQTRDSTLIPGTPDLFVAVQGFSYRATTFDLRQPLRAGEFFVPKPFRKIEYWQGGHMLTKAEGEKSAKRAARELRARLGV